jgi:SAM-dependent methyltransferase
MTATIYDEVIYPNRPMAGVTPARLAVIPALFGLDHAPPERCRVLEIAGGDGGHIIPLAALYPDAEFFGFDLAATRIEAGRRTIEALGLTNARLETIDILEAGDLGEFDYVIAHGIHTWVPLHVQEALMALIGRVLSPRGVAMVSFDCLPGCSRRRDLRDMMMIRLEGITEPRARLGEALRFLRLLVDSYDEDSVHEASLRKEALGMLEREPQVLFHDELSDAWNPVTFTGFVEQARRHGLQYLGEVEPGRLQAAVPNKDSARALIEGIVPSDPALQQYADFFDLSPFRRTLLRRGGEMLDRRFDAERVRGLYVSSELRPDPEAPHMYGTPSGSSIEVRDPRLIELLERMQQAWPAAIPVDGIDESLLPRLLRLHLTEMALLQVGPSPFVAELSERPRVPAFARLQAAEGAREITTLTHKTFHVGDELGLYFITLLDGTRGPAELAAAMAGKTGAPVEAVAQQLEGHLGGLLRAGMLEA